MSTDTDSPVLVTGAGGCIGAWTIKSLVQTGITPIAYDLADNRSRLALITSKQTAAKILWELGDVSDYERLCEIIQKYGIRAIIHLAALQVPFCKANPVGGAQANVVGTVNVLEAARQFEIKRITYASSVAAPAMTPGTPWLATLYGAYKVCGEQVARVYWQDWGVPSVGIRPAVVYGPARDQGMSAKPTLAMLAAAANIAYKIPFTGPVGFVYAADAANMFIQAVAEERDGAPVFDLNGDPQTVERLVDMITSSYPQAKITCAGDPLPFPAENDDGKLSDYVGVAHSRSLEDGMAETMTMFQQLLAQGNLNSDDVRSMLEK